MSDNDRKQLADRGISEAELARQQDLFRRPRRFVRLVRPCTSGDGIEVLSPSRVEALKEEHATSAAAGQWIKFVPASGAASRMFRDLLQFQKGEGRQRTLADVAAGSDASAEGATLRTFMEGLDRFAFHRDLKRTLTDQGHDLADLTASGDHLPILDALLATSGMSYETLPKALLKFHGPADNPRTPFEEHLVEAAHYARDRNGRCQLHFTVSPEHRAGFEALAGEVLAPYAQRYNARYDIDYSAQKPSTDTLAVDLENRPLRDADGRLVFRPAGHGALIENLNDLNGDLIFVKNIDNVQPDRLKAATLQWKPALAGLLVELKNAVAASLDRLQNDSERHDSLVESVLKVQTGIGRQLHFGLNGGPPHQDTEERRNLLIDRLHRPLRVCGVVPNTGEPGGGPFWVRGADGTVKPQIVESAEVDPDDEEQQAIFRASTHFNPVDLVCSVRDHRGEPFDLRQFVDPEAVIITAKSSGATDVKALERPGLWNGAMAGWNTVFVEVPLETFSPVKTVLDLLKDPHQA